jgi:hypothetical protein
MMKTLAALTSLVALSGCALGPYSPDFGDATRNNIAVQSVQPVPPGAAQPVPGNGALAAKAQDRYEKDNVKAPASLSTSNVGVASGGGSGSSGQ